MNMKVVLTQDLWEWQCSVLECRLKTKALMVVAFCICSSLLCFSFRLSKFVELTCVNIDKTVRSLHCL